MAQPFPRTQCRHQMPGGFSKSATAITLQHSVQVPHARPGATRDNASAAASRAPGGLAELASELMPIAFARNCVRCRACDRHGAARYGFYAPVSFTYTA